MVESLQSQVKQLQETTTLRNTGSMKFDFFSRKKFKCDICDEKFKTELKQYSKLEHGGKT
jgi:hypothetical protein